MIAIDSCTVEMPRSKEIIDYYGVHSTPNKSRTISLGRISQCFDVLNHISIDVQTGRFKGKGAGEVDCAIKHIEQLRPNDLVLTDRNYPCFYFFRILVDNGIDFCCRSKSMTWKSAKKLVLSDEYELIEELKPSAQAARKCEDLNLSLTPIKLRYIKVKLKTGEIEVLVTSLMNKEKYPVTLFSKLYFKRWAIEESYKEFKHRVQIENFSGKSLLSVEQDVQAKTFSINLTSILATKANNDLKNKKKSKHTYKVNWTNAYAKMKNVIPMILNNNISKKLLKEMLDLFMIRPIPIKNNRSFKRNRSNPTKYYMAYKQS